MPKLILSSDCQIW